MNHPVLQQSEEKMKKTIERMRADFASLRTGRANIVLLEGIRVESYGSLLPINQLGTVHIPEARTIEIKPWDVSVIPTIEKAVIAADRGLNPSNDGKIIRINIPALSEERRQELIRVLHKMTEEYRVALRNERREAVEKIKKAEKSREISEDDRHTLDKKIQELTDHYINEIERIMVAKEKEISEV